LWEAEHRKGQEEGLKDRPCAVVLVVTDSDGEDVVVVLPITHSPPADPADAIELPPGTKRRLQLDDERSWIVLTEANRFTWPGPDLRPTRRGDPASVVYGLLPLDFFAIVKTRFVARARAKKAAWVLRTE